MMNAHTFMFCPKAAAVKRRWQFDSFKPGEYKPQGFDEVKHDACAFSKAVDPYAFDVVGKYEDQ